MNNARSVPEWSKQEINTMKVLGRVNLALRLGLTLDLYADIGQAVWGVLL